MSAKPLQAAFASEAESFLVFGLERNRPRRSLVP
jgi:hypothetical protein